MGDWDEEQVVQWLTSVKLASLVDIVRREHIDGVALIKFTSDEWKEVGAPVGARVSVLERVRQYNSC